MSNDADTVPSGDEFTADAVEENVPVEDYSTRGQTTVATRRGYRFVPSNKSLPVVTHDGVKVTIEDAEALTSESKGIVFVVNKDEE